VARCPVPAGWHLAQAAFRTSLPSQPTQADGTGLAAPAHSGPVKDTHNMPPCAWPRQGVPAFRRGKAPSQQTNFKILYDEKFLYIAYRCHDLAPDSIVKRMSRRDEFPGDWVEINIDSYHDQRTAFSFTLSVSGVRGDEFVSENGNNWDAS